jgi:hypothetical protein
LRTGTTLLGGSICLLLFFTQGVFFRGLSRECPALSGL